MIDVQDYCEDKWGNLDGCSDVGSGDFPVFHHQSA